MMRRRTSCALVLPAIGRVKRRGPGPAIKGGLVALRLAPDTLHWDDQVMRPSRRPRFQVFSFPALRLGLAPFPSSVLGPRSAVVRFLISTLPPAASNDSALSVTPTCCRHPAGRDATKIAGVLRCFVRAARRHSSMSKSLQQHGIKEIYKQLRLSMKNHGLDTIKVQVIRRAGKIKCSFSGSAEQVAQADKILAAWA
jgi:hypothetical protein